MRPNSSNFQTKPARATLKQSKNTLSAKRFNQQTASAGDLRAGSSRAPNAKMKMANSASRLQRGSVTAAATSYYVPSRIHEKLAAKGMQ